MKYEYQVVRPVTPKAADKTLAELSAEGWALVAVDDATLYFERALPDADPKGLQKDAPTTESFRTAPAPPVAPLFGSVATDPKGSQKDAHTTEGFRTAPPGKKK